MTTDTRPDLARLKQQLVVAYRIFAAHGVLDLEGHISFRHPDNPDQFVMGRHTPASTITEADLLTLNTQGEVLEGSGTAPGERPVHVGVYLARPDVQAVCHSHTPLFITFSVSDVPLSPLYQWSARMGYQVPVWDSASEFGDTPMSFSNAEQAASLARTLGDRTMALVRGHGAVVAAGSLPELALITVYALENAEIQAGALSLGGTVKYLSEGETQLCNNMLAIPARTTRPWQAWAAAVGMPDAG
jgi:HCOMODA/2-hydroxy-3-carboxy-muconic semialdehyde decarboxylase